MSAAAASSSLLDCLTKKERDDLSLKLEAFVSQHSGMHRPVALVSSGGTAADLEVHSVRCLDNFSTGLRGAISVEGFLRRGYAVIHLWRQGSASPFARVLAQQLDLAPHAALDLNAIGKLFGGTDDDEEDAAIKRVLQNEDPWLTSNAMDGRIPENSNGTSSSSSFRGGDLHLSRGLSHSSLLQKTLRERKTVLQENRLLTVPFRTVDEYLAKLQISAGAINSCHSLALTYLAAAVSDFYVPLSERSEHKIQSSSSDKQQGDTGLTLQLRPVPKTIGRLRKEWAPSAFCISFKLETDPQILRSKAERAVENYGVHMVIGNILETRHSKVWILTPETQRSKTPDNARDWAFEEIVKSSSSSSSSASLRVVSPPSDELEELILDKVVESHFEFISWQHVYAADGIEAAKQAQEAWKEKRKAIQRQLFWKRANAIGTEVAGYLLSGLLSWAIASAIQRVRRAV